MNQSNSKQPRRPAWTDVTPEALVAIYEGKGGLADDAILSEAKEAAQALEALVRLGPKFDILVRWRPRSSSRTPEQQQEARAVRDRTKLFKSIVSSTEGPELLDLMREVSAGTSLKAAMASRVPGSWSGPISPQDLEGLLKGAETMARRHFEEDIERLNWVHSIELRAAKHDAERRMEQRCVARSRLATDSLREQLRSTALKSVVRHYRLRDEIRDRRKFDRMFRESRGEVQKLERTLAQERLRMTRDVKELRSIMRSSPEYQLGARWIGRKRYITSTLPWVMGGAAVALVVATIP